MIRDCYDGYCCIINQLMILVNANSFCAPSSPMYTELSQSHVGQYTARPLKQKNKTKNKTNKHLPTILHLSHRNG